MQDQATSPIMIEDEDEDDNDNDDERTPDASNRSANVQTNDDTRNRSSQQSSRGSSPRNTRSQDRFQELLRELSTPVRGEPVEANDEEETGEDSVPKSLARLYQKAMKAGLRATKANQEEISCWYNYAKGCEDRVKAIRESDSRLNGQQAMTQVYNEVKAHLPDITMANLRKKTQKARVIYKLFVNIGVGKIKRIKTYSADALSRLTDTQINSIIANFSE
jgi:hypothetical protein